jgi:hypothetical protein
MIEEFFEKIIIILAIFLLFGTGLVLAFSAPTAQPPNGGVSFWGLNGNDIYYNSGNVGIGTTTPAYALGVVGGDIYTSGYARSGSQVCIDSDCKSDWSWSDVPSNAIGFFSTSTCPSGWTEVTGARGRYIVGLPSGGTLAGTAGTGLTNLQNRSVGEHTNTINDSGHGHNNVLAMSTSMGGRADNAVKTHLIIQNSAMGSSNTGVTVGNAGTVAGTNAPYIQLLVCKKN